MLERFCSVTDVCEHGEGGGNIGACWSIVRKAVLTISSFVDGSLLLVVGRFT